MTTQGERSRSAVAPIEKFEKSNEELYGPAFYRAHSEGSLRSARVVVPLVLKMLEPRSVVDVGCGIGTWLSVFREYGVERIIGLDGPHIDPSLLKVPREFFIPVNLAEPFRVKEEFDLAVCLEVAEHLPRRSADGFVKSLVQLAPVIVFSAGIPLQGGTHHINEQWPAYWEDRFHEHNYRMLDPIRGQIWKNGRVDWWYRQNVVMCVREDVVASNPVFRETAAWPNDLVLIHQSVLERHLSLRAILTTLPKRVLGATYRRLERVISSLL